MRCFRICYGHPPFQICYTFCFPDPIRIWPPQWPDPWPYVSPFTINGERPEWLSDVYSLVLAARSAELAQGEFANVLEEAVRRGVEHVQGQLPEGLTLSVHEHAHAAAGATA